jgi:hypothetical protein
MNTGEDAQGLRKIIDFTRLISIAVLCIHFYICCYAAFASWGWTAEIIDKLIGNIAKTGLFTGLIRAKLAALLFLGITVLAAKGKKDEKIQKNSIAEYLICGLLVYFLSPLVFYLPYSIPLIAGLYMALSGIGYLLILTGGTWLSRLIKNSLVTDVFNSDNETFPQEERLLENEYSFNLPTKYNLKGKIRNGWINCVNPFRSILIVGSGGAGKTYFVIRHILDQQLRKGFCVFLYDFKFDDLTKMAYNKLLKYRGNYLVKPAFYIINFEDLNRTHRCNPLDPSGMEDITDATEASRTIMMGLNKQWLKETGDFFVESPINFLTAVIWYLRKYQDGKYCTLPHVIELMQNEYEKLFKVLWEEEEVRVLIDPFISALRNNAQAQLEGQIASAKIGLARLHCSGSLIVRLRQSSISTNKMVPANCQRERLMIKNKLTPGQSLATMKDGKVDYVTKSFQGAYYNPVVENTVYVNKGVGFNMVQSASMLQNGAAYRDDLVSRQGVKYEAWNIYKFDELRDNYGNLRVKQFNSGYGFKLEDELKRYEIKELDDPKKMAGLLEKLKDGERVPVIVEVPGAEARKLDVEAIPRYGNINFYDRDGKPEIRENFLKPGMGKEKEFGAKVEQGKQKGQEAGLGV